VSTRSQLRVYNTFSRQTEPFEGREPGKASIYCCGPTVYDVPHAGHARAAVAFDVLVRHLRAVGVEVTYVRNVTDIDDKILARARENGEEPLALSRRMEGVYQEQMELVGCVRPDHEPRVSDHLQEVIQLIERLVNEGRAYLQDMPSGTRDVYFSVRSFPGYGKLSRRNIEDMKVGARVAKEDAKQDPLDFALWKGVGPEEWGWESPWGRGRPGWHIECSAMSTAYLGHGFDIHAGGMDLVFPHHENEIAQSEGASPGAGPYARYWMHNGFVNVDKEKMSKSLGNFVTVRDVLERNDPEGFRWFLLSVHYRGPIQFDTDQLESGRVVFPGIDEAEARVDYMYGTVRRLRDLVALAATVPAKLPPELIKLRDAGEDAARQAREGLNDDLNTPVALAALGELAKLANEVCDMAHKRRKDQSFVGSSTVVARAILVHIERLAGALGLLRAASDVYRERTMERRLRLRGLTGEAVQAKVDERNQARKAKDFGRSDAIRDELVAMGIALQDGPGTTSWTVAP
jgi:cysteinyl-tRNA synthetase